MMLRFFTRYSEFELLAPRHATVQVTTGIWPKLRRTKRNIAQDEPGQAYPWFFTDTGEDIPGDGVKKLARAQAARQALVDLVDARLNPPSPGKTPDHFYDPSHNTKRAFLGGTVGVAGTAGLAGLANAQLSNRSSKPYQYRTNTDPQPTT